jgi:hypothetical protein
MGGRRDVTLALSQRTERILIVVEVAVPVFLSELQPSFIGVNRHLVHIYPAEWGLDHRTGCRWHISYACASIPLCCTIMRAIAAFPIFKAMRNGV